MVLPREFEWDDAKAATNEAEHGVPFAFAIRVFLDPNARMIETVRERDNETRSKAIGRMMVDSPPSSSPCVARLVG